MRESIFSKYKNFVLKNWESVLLPEIAEMVAHAVLFEQRRATIHDFDPGWDSSGTTVIHPDGGKFNETNYQKLSEFLEEVTGDTIATYVSGCGLHHRTYRDKASDIFSDFLQDCREQLFSLISSDESQFLFSICKKSESKEIDRMDISEIFEELEFYDKEVDFEITFDQWLDKLDFQWMFRMGEPPAIKTYQERKREMEAQASRLQIERERSLQLFELLKKKYRLKYQGDLPPTIGKPGPYFHQIKQLIQNFSKEDQEVLFIYGPFSNSIRDEAQRMRKKAES